MGKKDEVVLVNERDQEIGTAGKMEAHRSGALHRAFSVFLYDSQGHVLLQQRALGKYHSGGLWSNACCGHPPKGEDVRAAAEQRTLEELGVHCTLKYVLSFRYHAEVGEGLTEHEFDHVFVGRLEDTPRPDPEEVMALRWCSVEELDEELRTDPTRFTPWFALCWERVAAPLRQHPAHP